MVRLEALIPAGNASLPGNLTTPRDSRGVVIFAHGSGSSRFSTRNRYVASRLGSAQFATLLFDLLTPEEDADYENRFNIEMLTTRLSSAVLWAQKEPELSDLPIGLFGASTGAAAALKTAARMGGGTVGAVVSRGGRPDLAKEDLASVESPTLLIVGGADTEVLYMNRQAVEQMPSSTIKEIAVIPGATHLFEEEGALEKVADLAVQWFDRRLIHH